MISPILTNTDGIYFLTNTDHADEADVIIEIMVTVICEISVTNKGKCDYFPKIITENVIFRLHKIV